MPKISKQNKISFYIRGFTGGFLPAITLDKKINRLYNSLSAKDLDDVEMRVDYYNKINVSTKVLQSGKMISDLRRAQTPKAYYFDTHEHAKYFPRKSLINYAFGDVNTILDNAAICKSRPINGDNKNNILLNLDKARHFVSVQDKVKFEDKKDLILGRAAIYQEHRMDFYNRYFADPLCDLGQVNKIGGKQEWIKPKMSIGSHLDFKFILSLEGNDVATNLKWIMSSNSIAVSLPLKMETWYMEGILKPDEHFIGLKEDGSNLEEKILYYINNPKECNEIIKNAQTHRRKFLNKNKESLISLLVLKKYFYYIR